MRPTRAGLIALFLLSASPLFAQATGSQTYKPDFFASAKPATAMDMISRLPGFSFDGGDQSRGFSGNAGNVLIDGQRPSSKSDSLSTQLSRILANDVDHIDVIRGGAPGIDMQGRTIIANVVRKKGNTTNIVVVTQANIMADGTTAPGGRAEFSTRVGDRTYEASIRRDPSFTDTSAASELDVIDASNTLTRTPTIRSGSGANMVVNGAMKSPLAGGNFGANVTLQTSYFNNASLYKYSSGPQNFSGNSRNQRGELGANYQHKIGDATLDVVLLQTLSHSIGYSFSAQSGQTASSSSLNDTGESIGRLTLRYPFGDFLSVEGGGEFAYNFLRGQSGYSQNGAVVTLPSSAVLVEETRGEAFGQFTWQIQPTLTLEAGLRTEFSTISESGDINSSRSFFYPKPRALLSWNFAPDSQLRARVEHKLGQLSFGDFISSTSLTTNFVSAGNPDVQPDQRWQYELAYEQHFWNKGAVTLTLLHQEIDNLLDYKPFSGPGYIFDVHGNIGSGRTDQLSLNWTVPFDNFGIENGLFTGGLTWHDSAVRDPVTGVMRRVSGDPPNSYNFGFSQDLPQWNSAWSVYYNTGYTYDYYYLSEVDRSFGMFSAGASWSYTPQPNLKLSLSVNNIFGYRYENRRNIYAGPRDVSALTERRTDVTHVRPSVFFSLRKTFN